MGFHVHCLRENPPFYLNVSLLQPYVVYFPRVLYNYVKALFSHVHIIVYSQMFVAHEQISTLSRFITATFYFVDRRRYIFK